jgi:hypothetical protein
MGNPCWTIVVLGTLCVRSAAQEADSQPGRERTTLDQAVALTGLQRARLPILLTSTLPPTVSVRAEAWTVFDEACKGDRIFVYTRTAAFQCASDANPLQRQCLFKLLDRRSRSVAPATRPRRSRGLRGAALVSPDDRGILVSTSEPGRSRGDGGDSAGTRPCAQGDTEGAETRRHGLGRADLPALDGLLTRLIAGTARRSFDSNSRRRRRTRSLGSGFARRGRRSGCFPWS